MHQQLSKKYHIMLIKTIMAIINENDLGNVIN